MLSFVIVSSNHFENVGMLVICDNCTPEDENQYLSIYHHFEATGNRY